MTGCADFKVPSHSDKAFKEASQVGTKNPLDTSYALGVGDELTVTVWRQDDLKRSVRIDPTGNADFPLIGQVHLFGLTVNEARSELQTQLAQYIINPQVDISITAFNSLNLYVLGEVKAPGVIESQRYLTVWEALAAANGITEDARNDYVLVLRRNPDGTIHGIAVDVSLENKSQTAFFLKGGDVVYVPQSKLASVEDFMSRINTILGPLFNLGRGIILTPDVVDVFTGKAFETNFSAGSNANVINPPSTN